MSNTKKPMRGRAPKDAGRKIKKKANILSAEKVDYIDYKDINLLQRFMSDRSKIRGQKIMAPRCNSSVNWPMRSRTPVRWPFCRTPSASPRWAADRAAARLPKV